jgi:hypothetical protein
MRFDALPEPLGNDFGSGVFEAGNFVQVPMVELTVDDGLHDLGEVPKILDPTKNRIKLSAHLDPHFIAVTVQAPALVTFRDIGKEVRSFKSIGFGNRRRHGENVRKYGQG